MEPSTLGRGLRWRDCSVQNCSQTTSYVKHNHLDHEQRRVVTHTETPTEGALVAMLCSQLPRSPCPTAARSGIGRTPNTTNEGRALCISPCSFRDTTCRQSYEATKRNTHRFLGTVGMRVGREPGRDDRLVRCRRVWLKILRREKVVRSVQADRGGHAHRGQRRGGRGRRRRRECATLSIFRAMPSNCRKWKPPTWLSLAPQ